MTDSRLPLMILGGWLGAGKTTWLRHQLHAGLQAHVIVNEAAGVAVDDALLSQAKGVTVLAGGCACCDGRDDLVAALRSLADRRSAGDAIPEIILETSGLADPAAIITTITADPVLVRHFRVTGATVLVDAANGAAELAAGALAIQQIRAASALILTKTDAAPPLATARLAATLAALNPLATLSAAVAGVTVPLPPGQADPLPLAQGMRAVTAVTLPLPAGADWAGLSLWLSALLHAQPIFWLDVLDIPIVQFLDASFAEGMGADQQKLSRSEGDSLARYGANMLPLGYEKHTPASPIFNYPYDRSRAALEAMRHQNEWDPCHGLRMRYINPVNGDWAMPSIGTTLQLLPKGFDTQAYRSTDATGFVAVEGRGHSIVAGQRIDWGPRDVFIVPSWHEVTHHPAEDSVLFAFSDRPIQEKLGLHREKRGNQ